MTDFSTYEQAEERPAFSNGTEWDMWSSQWCNRCIHDINEDCPLILIGFMGRTPVEWKRHSTGPLSCERFSAL